MTNSDTLRLEVVLMRTMSLLKLREVMVQNVSSPWVAKRVMFVDCIKVKEENGRCDRSLVKLEDQSLLSSSWKSISQWHWTLMVNCG